MEVFVSFLKLICCFVFQEYVFHYITGTWEYVKSPVSMLLEAGVCVLCLGCSA